MPTQRYQQKMWDYLWWVEKNLYLCGGLLLIIDAFGRQSSMRCVAIISCSECAPLYGGVTLRSGGQKNKMIDFGDAFLCFKESGKES